MKIQPINNQVFKAKSPSSSANNIARLEKLGVKFVPGHGMVLPQNAAPETLKQIEKIMKEKSKDFKISQVLPLNGKIGEI